MSPSFYPLLFFYCYYWHFWFDFCINYGPDMRTPERKTLTALTVLAYSELASMPKLVHLLGVLNCM